MLSLVWAAILGPQRSIVKVRVLPFCPNLHRLEAAPRGPRREGEAEFRPEHRGLALEVGTVQELVLSPRCLGWWRGHAELSSNATAAAG